MRADQLLKRRQQEHEQMEMKKKKIEEEINIYEKKYLTNRIKQSIKTMHAY